MNLDKLFVFFISSKIKNAFAIKPIGIGISPSMPEYAICGLNFIKIKDKF